MRAILTELLRYVAPFDILAVTGAAAETRFEAVDDDAILFFRCVLSQPIPEFDGAFGMRNPGFIAGALADADLTLSVKRRTWGAREAVEQFEFKDATGHGGLVYRCAATFPQQASIPPLTWSVSCKPEPAKVVQLEKTAKLFAGIDKLVRIGVKDGHLVMSFGEDTASTHHGSLVFSSDLQGAMASESLFNCDHLLKVLKLAGANAVALRIAADKALNVEVQTPVGPVDYFLRPMKR